MQSRFVAVPAALILLCASIAMAQAQYLGDPDGRYSGGQTSKRYEFLGGMSYVGAIKRETVRAPGSYALFNNGSKPIPVVIG